jgi:hypothetical protein
MIERPSVAFVRGRETHAQLSRAAAAPETESSGERTEIDPRPVEDIEETVPVSTSIRLIGLMMAAVLVARGAAAAEPPLPGPDDLEMPSKLWLPTFERGAVPPGSPYAKGAGAMPGPIEAPGGEAIESFEGYDQLQPTPYDLWDDRPARIESTGTWLNRGLWYVEADAVVLNRVWSRKDQIFAAEDANISLRQDFPPFTPFIPNTNRLLILKKSQPGEDTSVRVTLGRFIHRDLENRDHTAEFTAFGGGDWAQNPDLASENPFGLYVSFILAGGNRTFDGSSRQSLKYGSHYSSFEMNYRVRERLGRDQLIMEPDGCWHRNANCGFSKDYLVGLRMLEMRDILDWRAEDITVAGDDGYYSIRTDNDLFGFQTGIGFDFETGRWSIGLHGKGGVYLNDILSRSTLNFTADDTSDFDLRMSTDSLSFIGEAQVLARWHLSPNFSLRAGCEIMYLTGMALAPHQVNFVTTYNQLANSDDPFFAGASFGFEGYW